MPSREALGAARTETAMPSSRGRNHASEEDGGKNRLDEVLQQQDHDDRRDIDPAEVRHHAPDRPESGLGQAVERIAGGGVEAGDKGLGVLT